MQMTNANKHMPFYAENTAFVDSNYTFRPNSNMQYDNILAYQAKLEKEHGKYLNEKNTD